MTSPKPRRQRHKSKPRFSTPEERAALPSQKAPYWTRVKKLQALGFQKNIHSEVWLARLTGYSPKAIGVPPESPNPKDYPVYSYAEAMAAAEVWCDEALAQSTTEAKTAPQQGTWVPGSKIKPEDPTVGQAIDHHLALLEVRQIEAKGTARSKASLLKKALGTIRLSALTGSDITAWQTSIVTSAPKRRAKKGCEPKEDANWDPDLPENKRRRQSTANRYLGDLLAALNLAYTNKWVESDKAWSSITKFADATGSRDTILDAEQQSRLLNAATPELRPVVFAALLTGSRPGPILRWKVKAFRPLDRAVAVGWDKRHNRERLAPLSDEAIAVFHHICRDRDPEEPMFVKANGKPWGRNHYARPFKEAMATLGIEMSMYGLRHTCITAWLASGIEPAMVASAVGTSTGMIEKHYKNPRVGSLADTLNQKAPRIGSYNAEVDSINAMYAAQRQQRLQGKLELKFTLASLHPSHYVGKAHGGLADPPPDRLRPTREQLEERVRQMPLAQVADHYGVSGTTIKAWCLKLGIVTSKRGDWAKHMKELRERGELPPSTTADRPPKPTKEELIALIQEMPATEIGKRYGVRGPTVLKWARNWDIPCPGPGYWAAKAGQEYQREKKARVQAEKRERAS